MIKTESACVDCQLPCLGNSCPLINVECLVCDECGEEPVDCSIDGRDLCKNCAYEFLEDCFNQLTYPEKSKILGLDYKNLY